MKQHIRLISDFVPKSQRERVGAQGVASNYFGDWSDSSADLRLGLDVVDLSDTHWADTQQLESELPRGT
jgi:hypothetical protein